MIRHIAVIALLFSACATHSVPTGLSQINVRARLAQQGGGDCKDHVRAIKKMRSEAKALITCFNMRVDCHASAVVEQEGVSYVLDNGDLGFGFIMPLTQYKAWMAMRPDARYGIFEVEILDKTKR